MTAPCRTLVITSGSDDTKPWWWDQVEHDCSLCQLDHRKILLKNGRLSSLLSWKFAAFSFEILRILRRARNRYAYVVTFECGWESFLVSLVQTLTRSRRPRHVILQFLMREKTPSLRSRIKYVFMRWCFSSVLLCVCSSRAECGYYQRAFAWPCTKFHFVPLHTDRRLLTHASYLEDDYVLSAGRTFRDYRTLVDAFRDLPWPLRVIASPENIARMDLPKNVTVQYDVPSAELVQLITRCLIVVVPLENRKISTGQSVILQAMTLGKAVIATRIGGTEDYIEHMKTGILVPPSDAEAIRKAVLLLARDTELRLSLGRAALDRVINYHLPSHYLNSVSRQLGLVAGPDNPTFIRHPT